MPWMFTATKTLMAAYEAWTCRGRKCRVVIVSQIGIEGILEQEDFLNSAHHDNGDYLLLRFHHGQDQTVFWKMPVLPKLSDHPHFLISGYHSLETVEACAIKVWLNAIEARGECLPFSREEIVVQFLSTALPLPEPSDYEVQRKMSPLHSLPFAEEESRKLYPKQDMHFVHVTFGPPLEPLLPPFGRHYPYKLFATSLFNGRFAVQLVTRAVAYAQPDKETKEIEEIHDNEAMMAYAVSRWEDEEDEEDEENGERTEKYCAMP